MGDEQPDGTVVVTFGRLFERYTKISNSCCMLLRARKQNLVDFQGEMLFQRRDVNVVITFLRMPEDIQNDSDAVLEYFCKTSHLDAIRHIIFYNTYLNVILKST